MHAHTHTHEIYYNSFPDLLKVSRNKQIMPSHKTGFMDVYKE